MRGRSRFGASRYRRERMIVLERKVEFLDGERRRLERLLGMALAVAVAGTSTTPPALLNAICDLEGINPARAAMFEERR